MTIIKIYTSYFSNVKKIPADIKRISIANFTPKKIKCDLYLPAAPPMDLLNKYKRGEVGENEFIIEYESYLDSLDGKKVVKQLEQLAGGRDVVLLCYESIGDFCHRHLFLEWLQRFCKESVAICGEYCTNFKPPKNQ